MQADGELGEEVVIVEEKAKKYSSKKQSDINNFFPRNENGASSGENLKRKNVSSKNGEEEGKKPKRTVTVDTMEKR